jgi:polyphosphate kinase
VASLTRDFESAAPAAAPDTKTVTAAEVVSQATIDATALDQVWFNRDMSWLEFNSRVLAEALDERTPLLERAKFLAIFTSNLDEFFMKRIAVLREDASPERQELMGKIRARLLPMLARQAEEFREHVVPGLARHGIYLKRWLELSSEQRAEANTYFDTQVSPALTPLIIHSSQPFPFFSNLSLSLALVLHDPRTQETIDARVKVPAELPQWIELTTGVASGSRVFVRLHAVIRENAQKLYPGTRILSTTLFRLTRDAEVEVSEDDFQGLREMVREQIRQRRYEPAVRLEFGANTDPRVRELLKKRFALTDNDIFDLQEELDYTSLFQIAGVGPPELRFAPWTPVTPPRLADDSNIFDVIREGDVLLHHPYESFDESVERFIRSAATDVHTVAIKMTVYRVGDDTPFVRSLIKAAEAGKQVACVIELKARFDEERNLHWAAELERAGAHVTVGNVNLKTHAKVALVVRKEASGLRSYAHIGTGNYHVRTARLYTDVGLLTCDPSIVADVVTLFHQLTGHSAAPTFDKLLVAPVNMRERFVALIRREIDNKRANRPARIIAKMNQLEDAEIIATLCEASNAGVPIDLVIRGFCCIRPGIAGATENVRVRSIVGRFLEHSRIWYFAAGQEDPLRGEFFIGSADWMYRNLSNRVEVAAPVAERSARARLWEILELALQDRRQAWVMDSSGSYQQQRPEADAAGAAALGTQQMLIELTRSRAS